MEGLRPEKALKWENRACVCGENGPPPAHSGQKRGQTPGRSWGRKCSVRGAQETRAWARDRHRPPSTVHCAFKKS